MIQALSIAAMLAAIELRGAGVLYAAGIHHIVHHARWSRSNTCRRSSRRKADTRHPIHTELTSLQVGESEVLVLLCTVQVRSGLGTKASQKLVQQHLI